MKACSLVFALRSVASGRTVHGGGGSLGRRQVWSSRCGAGRTGHLLCLPATEAGGVAVGSGECLESDGQLQVSDLLRCVAWPCGTQLAPVRLCFPFKARPVVPPRAGCFGYQTTRRSSTHPVLVAEIQDVVTAAII